MAGVVTPTPQPAPHPAPAAAGWQQLRAIGWLRWRILANGFRRKGGAGELIGRILVLPIFAAMALMPTVGAGILAWYLQRSGDLHYLSVVLWTAFGLTQLVNINLGQASTTFDPAELIRFPMPLARFVLVRLCFGLLSPANVIVSLMSVAVVIGLSLATPSLFVPAALALLLFALTNVLFTRMVFAWVDRWLSTRRSREVFTAIIFLSSLLFQYANATFNPGLQRGGRRHPHAPAPSLPGLHWLRVIGHALHPLLAWLPPELTASSIVAAAHHAILPFLTHSALCGLYGLVFLVIYTVRMRTEFRGENLSEAAHAVSRAAHRSGTPPPSLTSQNTAQPAAPQRRWPPRTLGPLLGKELLTLRRNVGLFYGLVAPAVMVFLFAGRLSMRGDAHWIVLAAVTYALLGISPLSYNTFGTEGTGAQVYFFAPVSLREVFFAKNLFALLIAFAEVFLVLAVVTYTTGRVRPPEIAFALLWAIGTLLFNTTLGNLRSVSAPKRVNPGRAMNKAQSAVSGYIAMGVLLGCAALGFGCQLLSQFLHLPWLGLLLMLAFALAGGVVYWLGLNGIETYTLERRDLLFEELGKKT